MSLKSHARRALTLIELLVVLAILAIALSLIGPGLERHRGNSRLIAERGNLRVLAQLMAKYGTDDPDGIIGPVHPRSRELPDNFKYSEFGGGPGTPILYHALSWNQQFDPRTRPFNHYLYGKNRISPTTGPGDKTVFKVFQCTGQELGWEWVDPWDYDTSNTPYFGLTGTAFRLNALASSDTSWGIYSRSAARIPSPAITLAFMETRAYQTLYYNDVWGYYPAYELTSYHDKRGFFSVIYCDGRADFVDFGFGTYYPDNLRGSWGRMDCYPEPPIPLSVPQATRAERVQPDPATLDLQKLSKR